jgi:hypothetical protein
MDSLEERLRHAADRFGEARDDALSLLFDVMSTAESCQNAEIVEQVVNCGILAKLPRADAMVMFEMALPALWTLQADQADSLVQRLRASMGGATVDDLSRHLPEVSNASVAQQMIDLGADPNFVINVDEQTGVRTTALGQSIMNKNAAAYTEMIAYLAENDQIPWFQYSTPAPEVGDPGTVTAFDRLISYTAAGWTAEIDVFDRLRKIELSDQLRGAIGQAVLDYNQRTGPGTMGEQCVGAPQRKIALLSMLAISNLGGPQGWIDVMQPANKEAPNLFWTSCIGIDGQSKELGMLVLQNAVREGLDPNAVRAVLKGDRIEGSWLSAAAYNYNYPMVQALLEAGVDPYKTINLTGGTFNAFELARDRGDAPCQQILDAWAARNAIAGVLEKARAGKALS